MILTASTQRLGLLGGAVAHSLSPRIHGIWLERHAIDAIYMPLPVAAENLHAALRGLLACGFRGANVTVPHKLAAHDLCDRLNPAARRAHAVNTLLFDPDHGTIAGLNTDGAGFLASLPPALTPPAAALVLGAGGAARAIAAALLDTGWTVAISARDHDRARTLAAELRGGIALPWPGADALAEADLLVNATSGGMAGGAPLAVSLDRAPPRLTVADIVYAPRETRLLAEARARGLATVEGLEMLLHQAAFAFQVWFGILPAVDDDLRRRLHAP